MGSVQSKIRRLFKKKPKKTPNNNLPTKTTQDAPPKNVPGESSPAPGALQQQANATYQDTGVVLRESQIPSEAIGVPDNVSSSPILPSPHTSVEMNGDAPQLEHGTTAVSDVDLATSPQCEVGSLLSSHEVADTAKARISMLWREAIENLKQKEKIEVEMDSEEDTYTMKPVQNLLDDVKKNRAIIENQRIRYRNSEGEYVAVADTIFRELNNYAFVGDKALQHHPDVVALVWSGFRLLLHIGTSYANNLAMILSSLGYLAWVICCGALYEDLYLEIDSELSRELRDCLVAQYVLILSYLSYANEHLQRNKTERIFESLSPRLSRLLDNIRESEKTIKERADIAERKAASTDRSEQDASRRELADNLKHVRERLENVKTAVDECHTKLSKLCHFIDKTIFDNTLDWVCHIQYGKIHEEHSEKRTADTCIWLENNRIFQEWVHCRSSSAVLWLRGAAGTGKTILASSIIDLLNDKYKMKRSLAYFYCSITSRDRITPESVLRAITKQLCHAHSGEKLPKKLVEIKDKRVRESAGLLSLEESTNLIIELSNYLSSGVWIVIDALDECDGSTRKNLFTSLDKIVTGGKDIRIFLTGRDEADIRGYMMQRHQNYLIDPRDNASDIELYIKSELRKLYEDLAFREVEPELVTQMKSLEKENIESLKGNANGMFLSVHHRMKALRVETTLHGVQKAIKDFPKSLNAVYADILKRISRQSDTDSASAHDILKWLFYAVDDFSADTILEALRHTVSVKESGNSKPKARTVRNAQNICCGLVTHDEKTKVLRFSHATVKEYLERLNGPDSCLHGGHEFMSDICLRILTISNYRIDEQCTDGTSSQAFINYATRNWGNHVRHCESRDSCQAFLEPSSSSYKAWSSKAVETIPDLRMKGPKGGCVDLLWVTCYYRLLSTFKISLETIGAGCINAAGRTPLHHCAEHGYLEFVEHLVKHKDIAVNAQDDMKRTPLLLAIISNQVDVVRALLKHPHLQVYIVDKDRRTALMHASMIGSENIVELLLDSTKCDVNVRDTEGYTALHYATLNRHESILDLLLRVSSLNINARSTDGSTALWLSVRSDKNIAVVEKLLSFQASTGRAIDPNLANDKRETPLCVAARLDQQEVTERLIEDKRVDINCGIGTDNMFIEAAARNKTWLVKLLVARGDLAINRPGMFGWTALSNATRIRSLDALKYIIAAPSVDIECKDDEGDTLLHLAIKRRSIDIALELLAHGASTSAVDGEGQTALMLAVENGSFDVFKVLLAQYDKAQSQDRGTYLLGVAECGGDVRMIQLILDWMGYNTSLNHKNDSGQTGLMIAAANGFTKAVQTLLKKDAIEVNAVDDKEESALTLAILSGHNSVIDALVEHPNIEIKLPAHNGTAFPRWAFQCTNDKIFDLILKSYPRLQIFKGTHRKRFISLISAASCNDMQMMQFLLTNGYNINYKDDFGQTALIVATINGYIEVVQMLLEKEEIDINLVDLKGRSALLLATVEAHNEVVRMLLKKDGIDVNIVDKMYGQSPLLYAAKRGHTEVVQMLLEKEEIDINLVDLKGRSALLLATVEGHNEVVRMLLKKDGIDVNIVDKTFRQSPLLFAAKGGHTEVVQMLLEKEEIDINLVDYKERSPLLCAAKRGHTGVVQMLLKKDGIDVNIVDKMYGESPLLYAAKGGHTEVVQMLLEKEEIDINLVDYKERSPLLCAAKRGHTGVVQMLLEKEEIDINLVDLKGRSALLLATVEGHNEVVRMLLKKDGIDVNIVDKTFRQSPLLFAAENGYTEVVQMLLEKEEIDINPIDLKGRSALLLAIVEEHNEVVRMLLKKDGIDVNIVDKMYGESPLLYAAKGGHTEVVQMLLEKEEIDINLVDYKERSPLLCAARRGHTGVVQMLLEKEEIDINLVNLKGRSALLHALSAGYMKIIKTLLEHPQIDVRLCDHHGSTPLLLAAYYGYEEIFKYLFERSTTDQLQEMDGDDDTLLLLSAHSGHTRIMQLVLGGGGCNINHRNKMGNTALIYATEGGHKDAVEILLKENGVDLGILNNQGESALDLAKRKGHKEVFELLEARMSQKVE